MLERKDSDGSDDPKRYGRESEGPQLSHRPEHALLYSVPSRSEHAASHDAMLQLHRRLAIRHDVWTQSSNAADVFCKIAAKLRTRLELEHPECIREQ